MIIFIVYKQQQRIIGANNSDVLGLIQSVIQVTEEAPLIRSQALVKYANS